VLLLNVEQTMIIMTSGKAGTKKGATSSKEIFGQWGLALRKRTDEKRGIERSVSLVMFFLELLKKGC